MTAPTEQFTEFATKAQEQVTAAVRTWADAVQSATNGFTAERPAAGRPQPSTSRSTSTSRSRCWTSSASTPRPRWPPPPRTEPSCSTGPRPRARSDGALSRAAGPRGVPGCRPWRFTSSTAPTSCSATTSGRATGTWRPARPAACWPACCSWSTTGRPTSGWPPTTSSSRSATTCGRATSPPPACRRSCWPSSRWSSEVLAAAGFAVWPQVEYEADDGMAAAAALAAADERVSRVLICTPDKDLGPVRRRQGGAVRPAQGRGVRRGRGAGPARRAAGVDPRPARAGRRLGRRVPRAARAGAPSRPRPC